MIVCSSPRPTDAAMSDLTITASFSLGEFNAHDGEGRAEWPPVPVRVLAAMLSAAHGFGESVSWWYDFLTTPKLEFAFLKFTGGTVGELLDNAMDPTISNEDLKV